jgi:hypothetical protein
MVRSRRSYANVPNTLKTPPPGGPDNLCEDSKPQPVPTSSLTPDTQFDGIRSKHSPIKYTQILSQAL